MSYELTLGTPAIAVSTITHFRYNLERLYETATSRFVAGRLANLKPLFGSHTAPQTPPAPSADLGLPHPIPWLEGRADAEATLCRALKCHDIVQLRMLVTAVVLSECAYKRPDSDVIRFAGEFPSRYPHHLVDIAAVSPTLGHTKQRYVVAEGRHALYVAAMGTKDAGDYLSDADVRAGPVAWLQGTMEMTATESPDPSIPLLGVPRAHAGFLRRSSHLPAEDLYREATAKGKSLVLCGHSLGGCVASLAALRLLASGPPVDPSRVMCFTLAAVPVGNEAFARWVTAKGFDRNVRNMVLREDPIPELYASLFVATAAAGGGAGGAGGDAPAAASQAAAAVAAAAASAPVRAPSPPSLAQGAQEAATMASDDAEGEGEAAEVVSRLDSILASARARLSLPSLSLPSFAALRASLGIQVPPNPGLPPGTAAPQDAAPAAGPGPRMTLTLPSLASLPAPLQAAAELALGAMGQLPSYAPIGESWVVLDTGLVRLDAWWTTSATLNPQDRARLEEEALRRLTASPRGSSLLFRSSEGSAEVVAGPAESPAPSSLPIAQRARAKRIHHSMKWYQARLAELLDLALTEAGLPASVVPRTAPCLPVEARPDVALHFAASLAAVEVVERPPRGLLGMQAGPGPGSAMVAAAASPLGALGRKVRAQLRARTSLPSASDSPHPHRTLPLLRGPPTPEWLRIEVTGRALHHITSIALRTRPGGRAVPLRATVYPLHHVGWAPAAGVIPVAPGEHLGPGGAGKFLSRPSGGPHLSFTLGGFSPPPTAAAPATQTGAVRDAGWSLVLYARIPSAMLLAGAADNVRQVAEGVHGPFPELELELASDLATHVLTVNVTPRASALVMPIPTASPAAPQEREDASPRRVAAPDQAARAAALGREVAGSLAASGPVAEGSRLFMSPDLRLLEVFDPAASASALGRASQLHTAAPPGESGAGPTPPWTPPSEAILGPYLAQALSAQRASDAGAAAEKRNPLLSWRPALRRFWPQGQNRDAPHCPPNASDKSHVHANGRHGPSPVHHNHSLNGHGGSASLIGASHPLNSQPALLLVSDLPAAGAPPAPRARWVEDLWRYAAARGIRVVTAAVAEASAEVEALSGGAARGPESHGQGSSGPCESVSDLHLRALIPFGATALDISQGRITPVVLRRAHRDDGGAGAATAAAAAALGSVARMPAAAAGQRLRVLAGHLRGRVPWGRDAADSGRGGGGRVAGQVHAAEASEGAEGSQNRGADMSQVDAEVDAHAMGREHPEHQASTEQGSGAAVFAAAPDSGRDAVGVDAEASLAPPIQVTRAPEEFKVVHWELEPADVRSLRRAVWQER